MSEPEQAFEAVLLQMATFIEQGRAAEAGRVYDDAVRKLPGGRLPEPVEALRRAVTDLQAGAEHRAEYDPSWRALAAAVKGDPAPLQEHLAALSSAGQLEGVLGELRSIAPDAWPWVAPHIPTGWQPRRRELSDSAKWWVVGGLMAAVLGFLTLGAWLAPRGSTMPSAFSMEAIRVQRECDQPVTDADRFACRQAQRIATQIEAGGCEQAVVIAGTLDRTEGEAAQAVRDWAARALEDAGCVEGED